MDHGPNPTAAPVTAGARPGPKEVAAAVATLVVAIVLAAPGDVRVGEVPLLRAGNDLSGSAGWLLRAVMPLGTGIGALVLVVVALTLRRGRLALAAVGGWLLARVAAAVLKAVVDRPRPSRLLDDVVLRQHLPDDAGFPSAHTAIAVCLAVVTIWALPRLRAPALGLALLVAVARLHVGVHLPLDLVGGAALGLLAGAATTTALDRWWPPAPAPGDPAPGV